MNDVRARERATIRMPFSREAQCNTPHVSRSILQFQAAKVLRMPFTIALRRRRSGQRSDEYGSSWGA
jgi:hypothetical protein